MKRMLTKKFAKEKIRFHFERQDRPSAHPVIYPPPKCLLFSQMSYGVTKLVGVFGPGGQLKKNNPDLCENSNQGSA